MIDDVTTHMRRFSGKSAIVTFFAVLALDYIFLYLSVMGPEDATWWEWCYGVPFWVINFPGYPFAHYINDDSNDGGIIALIVMTYLFPAMFWSVAVGLYFGRKLLRSAPEPTAGSDSQSTSQSGGGGG